MSQTRERQLLKAGPNNHLGPRRRTELATMPKDPTAPFQYKLITKQRAFLFAYAAMNSVSAAAKKLGMSPATHHCWMRQDEEYKTAFLMEAVPMADQQLQDKAVKLGFEGWKDPIFYEGKKVGNKFAHDSALAVMLLK